MAEQRLRGKGKRFFLPQIAVDDRRFFPAWDHILRQILGAQITLVPLFPAPERLEIAAMQAIIPAAQRNAALPLILVDRNRAGRVDQISGSAST